MEEIIDHMIGKKTRKKTYFEYLVKWKRHPIKHSTWVNEEYTQKHGNLVWKLMEKSL
jgi:hypothetical protein